MVMTDEKLKKEAEDIVYGMGYDTYESDGHSDFAVQDILVKFAESKEKQIEELKQQIEQMKCCQNCKNTWNGYRMNICDDCKRLEGQIFSDTLTSDNWELRR